MAQTNLSKLMKTLSIISVAEQARREVGMVRAGAVKQLIVKWELLKCTNYLPLINDAQETG